MFRHLRLLLQEIKTMSDNTVLGAVLVVGFLAMLAGFLATILIILRL